MTYNYYQGVMVARRHLRKAFAIGALLAVAVSIALSGVSQAATSTVVVSGDTAAGENQPGWMFNRDPGTVTPFDFTTDEASVGYGSLHVSPIGANPSDKFVGELFYLGEAADVTSISFDYKSVNPADFQQFYLNLYTNDGSNPSEFYDCRYNVVPTSYTPNVSTGFSTLTFNLADTTSVAQRGSSSIVPCPTSPSGLPAGAVLRSIQLNVGDTSGSDAGVEGYLDNVVVNEVGGNTTVYDLDPAVSKEGCKANGWTAFGFKNQGQCVRFAETGKDSR